MKSIGLLLLLTVLAAGCHVGAGVRGSGSRQKEKREVAAFTEISTTGAFEIEVTTQKAQSLELEADDNILPLISTEVSNNVLHLKTRSSFNVSEPIRIKISVPNLEGVSVSGAGKIEIGPLKNDKFEVDLNGAATIRASGETKLLKVDSNGAGKIDMRKLRAERAEVDSNGVAKVEVHAIQQLDVSVSGPSHVVYYGDPVVNKSVNGPGTVERKVSEGS